MTSMLTRVGCMPLLDCARRNSLRADIHLDLDDLVQAPPMLRAYLYENAGRVEAPGVNPYFILARRDFIKTELAACSG